MLYPFQTVYTHAYIDKTFLMMATIGGSDLDCPTIQPFHLQWFPDSYKQVVSTVF